MAFPTVGFMTNAYPAFSTFPLRTRGTLGALFSSNGTTINELSEYFPRPPCAFMFQLTGSTLTPDACFESFMSN
jgi:hypothetical protein